MDWEGEWCVCVDGTVLPSGEAVLLGFSDSVKLVVIDHISSNYGLVFPVKVGWRYM